MPSYQPGGHNSKDTALDSFNGKVRKVILLSYWSPLLDDTVYSSASLSHSSKARKRARLQEKRFYYEPKS